MKLCDSVSLRLARPKRLPGLTAFFVAWATVANAQRVAFPNVAPAGENPTAALAQNGFVPETQMAPVTPRSSIGTPPPPSSTLGSPVVDPYQSGIGAGNIRSVAPETPAPPTYPGASGLGGLFSGSNAFGGVNPQPAPSANPWPFGAPATTATYPSAGAFPGSFPGAAPPPGYPPPGFGAPGQPVPGYPGYGMPPPTSYPPGAYPMQTPSTLFPGGLSGPGGLFNGGWGTNPYTGWPGSPVGDPLRLFQGPRIRHTWLRGGSSAESVGINTTDVSIAIALPNFLWTNQPLYVLPSFSLHLWDGPDGASGGNADLPSRVYDAFLDVGWQSDPMQMVGAELGLRVGVFTGFNAVSSDSLRIRGQGLGIFRLSPTTTLKGGVMYVDRNRIKLIPAGGILCQPHPFARYDITFPDPKFSHFVRTLGVYDVWAYLGGEFGGGAWAIRRDDGSRDSVDMYDFRVSLGLEWGQSNLIRAGRRTGVAEVGYVFGRRVEYKNNPDDDFRPGDTIMVRLGIGY